MCINDDVSDDVSQFTQDAQRTLFQAHIAEASPFQTRFHLSLDEHATAL